MANTFDRDPYPFPPRKGLLTMLGLPVTASESEYRTAYKKALDEAMTTANAAVPGRKAALQKKAEDSRIKFRALVGKLQTQNGLNYDKAFQAAITSDEGRGFMGDAEKFSMMATQEDFTQDVAPDVAFSENLTRSVDPVMANMEERKTEAKP